MMRAAFCFAVALFAIGSQAIPTSYPPLAGALAKRAINLINSPRNRGAWDGTHDINTDWYTTWPETGVVREYWLTVENSTMAPDGYERIMLTLNGTYPGPTLYADWGDTIKIHVTNNMQWNGTSIHWHGVRQLMSTEQDGVNGITQCPIAPGASLTYEWQATQYGTSWYHSHFSLQYAEGVVGALVINGPASANYDEDLGPVLLTDWYHGTAFSLWDSAQRGGPPPAQNGLINGINVFDCSTSTNPNCIGGGKHFEFPEFVRGKKYRLRLVNTSTDSHFRVSLDGHSMTVIAADFVPIKPYTTDSLSIGIGQRYDIIIEANAAAADYWFRATVQTACSASNAQAFNIRGIVRYAAGSYAAGRTSEPTSLSAITIDSCLDEPLTSLVPVVKKPVVDKDLSDAQDVEATLQVNDRGVIRWHLNGVTSRIDWANPTLMMLLESEVYPTEYHVLPLPNANEMYYMVIETAVGITHPIHLHGHDFYVLAQDTGPFNASATTINWETPMRRDVAMLPGSGHLVLGFETDNPGIWLMHCHIAWHVSGGFSLQFVERASDILTDITIDQSWHDTCDYWDVYDASGLDPEQEDSGLKLRI